MNTQQNNEISSIDSQTEAVLSVGQTLREARERLGMSVSDVANRIKFAPKQIEWLEADDFSKLPEAAFVRGFVRGYARLLELDSVNLLSNLPNSHVQSSPTQEVKSVNIPLPSALSKRRDSIVWLVAAFVIAVSLVIFLRMQGSTPNQTAKTTVQILDLPDEKTEDLPDALTEQAQDEEPAPVPEKPAVKAADRSAPLPEPRKPVPQVVVQPPSLQHLLPQQAVQVAPKPVTQPSVPQQTVRAVPASAIVVAPADGSTHEHALRLEFDEDAWVEIKEGDDKVLISRMHTAGSLVRVTGKAPMLVVIGNARAVRLFDNGKKINLEKHTTAEVARVKLN